MYKGFLLFAFSGIPNYIGICLALGQLLLYVVYCRGKSSGPDSHTRLSYSEQHIPAYTPPSKLFEPLLDDDDGD